MKKVPVYNLQTISCKPTKIGNVEVLRFEDHLKNIHDVRFPHRHDFYYILYIASGKGTHTIDFKRYDIKPGQLFFMSPGEIHEWDIKPETKGYTLFFDKNLFSDELFKIEEQWPYFHSLFQQPVFKLKAKDKAEVESWFELILKEYRLNTPFQENIVKHLLSSLLYKINAALDLHFGFTQSNKVNVLRNYELLIENNFIGQHQLDFYADKLNISPNYLNSLSKTALGKSAKHLLNERILLESKRLLHHSQLNINEISAHLNFHTASYFVRFFKKMEKITPLEFKKLK